MFVHYFLFDVFVYFLICGNHFLSPHLQDRFRGFSTFNYNSRLWESMNRRSVQSLPTKTLAPSECACMQVSAASETIVSQQFGTCISSLYPTHLVSILARKTRFHPYRRERFLGSLHQCHWLLIFLSVVIWMNKLIWEAF